MQVFKSKVFWGIAVTFIVSGLGGITGVVSPGIATWVTLIATFLAGIGHSINVVQGVSK